MAYGLRTLADVSILDLDGEIDLYKSPDVRADMGKLIVKKIKCVVINFQKVTYIDSSGLATMIDAFQKMRVYGGKLAIASLAKSVRSVFEVSRLDKLFTIYDDETSAVNSFRQDTPPSV